MTNVAIEPRFPARTPVLSAQAELFCEFVRCLNNEEIAYCILGRPEMHFGLGDVDFVVHPKQAYRIPSVLRQVARLCNAELVQAIRHETTACYFVLAKATRDGFAYLQLDLSTDYSRQGRLWLRAEELLRGRRLHCAKYYVPDPSQELLYYLGKKVLKQEIDPSQWCRIKKLYPNCPTFARQTLRRLWSEETSIEIHRLVAVNELPTFQEMLPALLRDMRQVAPTASLWSRARQQAANCARVASRIRYPTGLVLRVEAFDGRTTYDLSRRLSMSLGPAFRRTWIVAATKPSIPRAEERCAGLNLRQAALRSWDRLLLTARIARAVIMSTLVVGGGDLKRLPWIRNLTVIYNRSLSEEDNALRAAMQVIEYMGAGLAGQFALADPREASSPELPQAMLRQDAPD